ncbi:MAG TPA: hypothetical protein VIM84_01805 [Gemmatimonadales bacterium]
MMDNANNRPVMVFRMLDRNGQPIGQIIQPKVAPVVGLGARTVLLVRGREAAELRRN